MPSNQQSITAALFSYFRGKGFSVQQATYATAGAEGNLQTESSFSPTAYNAREGAQGIAQWEGGRGDNGALGAYARATGGSVTSLTTQEGYLEKELNGPYARTVAALRTATSPAQAAADWATDFEGNAPSSDGQRESNATNIYATLRSQMSALAAGSPVTFPDTGSSGSASSSASGGTATDTGIVSSLAGDVVGPIWGIVARGMLVVAGGGLIIVGMFRASQSQTDPAAVAALAAA